MATDYDMVIRVVAFVVGCWNAGHYFVGANQLRKAPHWIKTILFPSLVAGHIGMCLAAVLYGSGMVVVVAGGLWVLVSIKDAIIWRAGAYMSDVLDKQARMKERVRQAHNLYMYDLTSPVDAVNDFLTPSGFEEIKKAEERAKERA